MGFPKHNQLWKLRSKHGRDKLFASPELMVKAAMEYFEWCDNNPWKKQEAIKSGDMAGTTMDVDTARPYTMSGLCLYLQCDDGYFREFKNGHKEGGSDFSRVISWIEKVVETQQLEGAAVGTFNANIISRKLGLADKQDVTNRIITVEQQEEDDDE